MTSSAPRKSGNFKTNKIEVGISHITPVGGNIFLDLGFGPEEAKKLLEETDRSIAEKLASNGSAPGNTASKPGYPPY